MSQKYEEQPPVSAKSYQISSSFYSTWINVFFIEGEGIYAKRVCSKQNGEE